MDDFIAQSNCWPRGQHLLLLRAALAEPSAALAAWSEFANADGLEQMDEASFRLLPRVHQHLSSLKVDAPQAGKLRAVHRQAWCRNQIIFHGLADVLRTLRHAGIPTMVLKGVALSHEVYRDGGARPMRDADVLVATAEAARAHACLRDAGWRAADPLWTPETEAARRGRHAVSMKSPTGAELDLHWHPSYLARTADVNRGWWERARPTRVAGEPTLAPSVSDELVLAITHGLADNPIAAVRWVADAGLCLRQGVDWDVVLRQSRDWRVEPWMSDGLHYLQTEWGVDVPAEITRALAQPLSRRRRAEYHYVARPEAGQSMLDTSRRIYSLYLRGARDQGLLERWAGFVPYLNVYWKTEGVRGLSRSMAHWLWRRWELATGH